MEDDVKTPAAAVVETDATETALVAEEKVVGAVKTEESAAEGTEVVEAAETEPSADDLKAKIAALEQENADLKATDDEVEEEPAVKPAAPVAAKDPALTYFVTTTVQEVKKAFGKAETADEQVEVMVNATDKFVSAVFSDRQDPLNRGLAQSIIEVSNGQELMELLITPEGTVDTKLAKLVPQIKKALSKIPWAERSKPGIVTGIYHQLIGKTAVKATDAPAKKPAGPAMQASPAVKDAAAGSGTGGIRRPASKTTLTAEQEEERLSIETEGGHPYPPEKYLSSLKALQDAAKVNGRKVPATLRRL